MTRERRAPLRTAEVLAVGSELTTGDTRDTNGGEIARELTDLGVDVRRLTALPDDLVAVTTYLERAMSEADLVVVTGGLGPTPDDLTREAIGGALGETPAVDEGLESELRAMFGRRGLEMPDRNRKQAWLIPSATSLRNPNGTAPGWWVATPSGSVIVAVPGPPREMRPMWREEVLPRLRARGLGEDRATAVLRLAGIGESHVAELIGDELLASANPAVATYARADAVDVRVVARARDGHGADEVLRATLAQIEPVLAAHVFARDGETWVDAIAARLAGRTVAASEIGTGGTFIALVGHAPWLAFAETVRDRAARPSSTEGDLRADATGLRHTRGTDIGVVIRARDRGSDAAVAIAIADVDGVRQRSRTAFLGGEEGRRRAAVLACLELWQRLGAE